MTLAFCGLSPMDRVFRLSGNRPAFLPLILLPLVLLMPFFVPLLKAGEAKGRDREGETVKFVPLTPSVRTVRFKIVISP